MDVTPNALAGSTVVMTGKCLNSARADVEAMIERAGGTNAAGIAPGVTVVVARDWPKKPWQTLKLKLAIQHGVPIISDASLAEVLEGRITLQGAIAARPPLPARMTTPDGEVELTFANARNPTPVAVPLDVSKAFREPAVASPFCIGI